MCTPLQSRSTGCNSDLSQCVMPRSSTHADVNVWREAQSHINELHLLLTLPTGRHGLGHWNSMSIHTRPTSRTYAHAHTWNPCTRLDLEFISAMHFKKNKTKQRTVLSFTLRTHCWRPVMSFSFLSNPTPLQKKGQDWLNAAFLQVRKWN